MAPRLTYLVCSTQRSGSNLLCQLLQFSGVAGHPEEYFVPGFYEGYSKGMLGLERFPKSFREYLERIVTARTTPNGVFGAKMMRNYLDDFCSRVRSDPDLPSDAENIALLQSTLPNLKFVWLKRRNKIRQAISIVQAQLKNSYISSDDEKRPRRYEIPRDHFDYEQLKSLVDGYSQADREWQRFFADAGIEPVSIDYEDLVPSQTTAVPAIIEALGIELPADYQQPEPKHRKQSNELSQDWYDRYLDAAHHEAIDRLRADLGQTRS